MLRTVLRARGALNLAFALYFLIVPASGSAQNFQHFGIYLAADGLVALLSAGLLLRAQSPAWLKALASVDAVARALLGLWFLLVPELHTMVATRIFVLVIVCMLGVLVGAAGILMPLGLRVRDAVFGSQAKPASHWPLILASAALVAFVLALFSVFPDAGRMRIVLGLYVLALGAALLFARGAFPAAGRATPRPGSW